DRATVYYTTLLINFPSRPDGVCAADRPDRSVADRPRYARRLRAGDEVGGRHEGTSGRLVGDRVRDAIAPAGGDGEHPHAGYADRSDPALLREPRRDHPRRAGHLHLRVGPVPPVRVGP